jgi:hypothetical protein
VYDIVFFVRCRLRWCQFSHFPTREVVLMAIIEGPTFMANYILTIPHTSYSASMGHLRVPLCIPAAAVLIHLWACHRTWSFLSSSVRKHSSIPRPVPIPKRERGSRDARARVRGEETGQVPNQRPRQGKSSRSTGGTKQQEM